MICVYLFSFSLPLSLSLSLSLPLSLPLSTVQSWWWRKLSVSLLLLQAKWHRMKAIRNLLIYIFSTYLLVSYVVATNTMLISYVFIINSVNWDLNGSEQPNRESPICWASKSWGLKYKITGFGTRRLQKILKQDITKLVLIAVNLSLNVTLLNLYL